MSRSRAIDIRLERMVPAMEEYFIKGIFTKDELRDIAKQRTNHEYKLVARPLLYVDVRKAIDFELELEGRLAKFLTGAETQIKNRGAIVERIVHIYDIAISSIGKGTTHTTKQQQLERDALELQYLTFMKEFNRTQELSKYLAAELQRSPSNVNAWVFSVDWELSKGNIDNARSIAQEALKHCSSSSPKVWTSLMTVETSFASYLARGVLETDKTTKTTSTKKSKKNKNGKEDDQNDDATAAAEDKQDEERPLSQRYCNVNAALAKIVVDGELIRGACAAALDSQTGGMALLEDVEATLLKLPTVSGKMSATTATGEMCGRFIAKYLFAACAQKQLDEQTTAKQQNENSNDQNKNVFSSSSPSAPSLSVATKQKRSLNLTVAALCHLIQAPLNYFFGDHANPRAPAAKCYKEHQYWSTSTFLDQSPAPCPTRFGADAAENGNNNNSNNNKGNNNKKFKPELATISACELSLAAQTLQKLAEFSRSSTHPHAMKTALQLAQNLFNRKLVTKQSLADIFGANSKGQLQDSVPPASPACQQAFDECVADFDNLNQQLINAFNTSSNNKTSSTASSSSFFSVSNELHIDKWISPEFKDLLESSLNINITLSLAPKLFGSVSSSNDQKPKAEKSNGENGKKNKNEDGSSSSSTTTSFAALDQRTRSYLAQATNNNDKNESEQQLLADLNTWFNREFAQQSYNGISSKGNINDIASTLFGSEAVSNQITTMMLGRALLTMRKLGSSLLSSASVPARRGRHQEDDDSSSDDDQNSSAASSRNQNPFSGFTDIIRLFKLNQPKSPSQIHIRSHAVTVIASVWIEALHSLIISKKKKND